MKNNIEKEKICLDKTERIWIGKILGQLMEEELRRTSRGCWKKNKSESIQEKREEILGLSGKQEKWFPKGRGKKSTSAQCFVYEL